MSEVEKWTRFLCDVGSRVSVRKQDVDEILLALSTARADERARTVEECAKVCAGLRTNTKHGDGWRNDGRTECENAIRALQPPSSGRGDGGTAETKGDAK